MSLKWRVLGGAVVECWPVKLKVHGSNRDGGGCRYCLGIALRTQLPKKGDFILFGNKASQGELGWPLSLVV